MTTQQQTPPPSTAQRGASPTPWHRRAASVTIALVLLLAGTASIWSMRPPAPRPASVPQTEFSAQRALSRIDDIAATAHPAGSAAAADVRAFLVRELRGLGVRPTVQTRVASRLPSGGYPTLARVSNVHAHIPGSKPTGRVLLVAHYDSVPTGPGASDNGTNVAAVLEIVRTLRSLPQARNDIDVLFTDAEEPGLLGAQGFVDSGAVGDPRRVAVVNLEARGVSGPALMFQMEGGLTSTVADSDAVTSSFAGALYSLLPNDTDLTVLAADGMRGINFAYMDGVARYHTAGDDIAHVNAGSVQDMGDSGLAAVRSLSAVDLASDEPAGTYFSLFGTVVSYPGWLTLPLAVAALVLLVLVMIRGRRHGLRPSRAGLAAGSFSAVLLAAAGVGFGGWWLLTALQPAFGLGIGAVYHPMPYLASGALVMVVVLLVWYRWARRRMSPTEASTGVLGWFVALSLIGAVLLPGGAYLFTWPALIGLGTLLSTLSVAPRSPLHLLAAGAAALPATVLLLPVAVLVTTAVGLGLGAAPLLMLTLLAATALPLVEPRPSRRVSAALGAILLLGTAATAAVAASMNGYSAVNPRPVSLAYAWKANTGKATWLSRGGQDQPAVGRLLTAGPSRLDDRIPSLSGVPLYHGRAPEAPGLPEPRVRRAAPEDVDPTTGQRTVRLHLTLPDDVFMVDVFADTTHHSVQGATVDGVHIDTAKSALAEPWGWGFRYAALSGKGIDLTLRVKGKGPLRLRVLSTASSLPDGVDAPRLAPGTGWAGFPVLSGQTIAVRDFSV
ncbi:M20/M25/M40 family metallo-hydrolase [Streptomyces sp. SID8379]|uniref:M20/M25/M40 family metallo-hydrolase n=1 Tax=unclassified Streptomyces TaxID=2593676 RepID=UPI00037B9648|nr:MULTISPECIES: M20/M25/M40 family metallo-hydrolase [unclassified Streptomyces]MYW69888.1 M20/M25/M40 family metallo-hydrolase [Streptomyces sp. SID8379]